MRFLYRFQVLLIVDLIMLATAFPNKERLPNIKLTDNGEAPKEPEVYFQFPLLITIINSSEYTNEIQIKGDDINK